MNQTLQTVIIALVSLCVGGALSLVLFILVERYVKGHASEQYLRRLASVAALERLLSRHRKELGLPEETALWSEVMNLAMNARSEAIAKKYLSEVAAILGEKGVVLETEGKKVIEERFKTDPCAEVQIASRS